MCPDAKRDQVPAWAIGLTILWAVFSGVGAGWSFAIGDTGWGIALTVAACVLAILSGRAIATRKDA